MLLWCLLLKGQQTDFSNSFYNKKKKSCNENAQNKECFMPVAEK